MDFDQRKCFNSPPVILIFILIITLLVTLIILSTTIILSSSRTIKILGLTKPEEQDTIYLSPLISQSTDQVAKTIHQAFDIDKTPIQQHTATNIYLVAVNTSMSSTCAC
ncbi:unnamed protein product [Adineta ricciae]|uniref:Uncharacterized protein n=1 Tax=Adineta ricciae TaxID=249248 RepID=A0A815X9E8_ADIRI|nr:unnamed protein product [Adineta ricciae]